MISPEQVPQTAWLAMRDLMREGIRNEATLIAAALNAWPEMTIRTTFWPNDDGVWIVPRHALSLPLSPQPALGEPEHE